jgi:hypothetical protein
MSDLGSELRRLLAERAMSLRDLARHVPCDSGNCRRSPAGRNGLHLNWQRGLAKCSAPEVGLRHSRLPWRRARWSLTLT